jgi:hypothetical protein
MGDEELGEWVPSKVTLPLTLLFDVPEFPIGKPNSCGTLQSMILLANKDSKLVHGLQLSKSVIDQVKVRSCEVVLGGESVKPHVFSVKLYDNNSKLIPHDMLTAIGHPVGQQCTCPSYYKADMSVASEARLRQFGHYTSRRSFKHIFEGRREPSGGLKLPDHLAGLADQFELTNLPRTEGRRNARQQRVYDDAELNDLLHRFGDTMSEVHDMFHDMTSLRAELSVSGNEITVAAKSTAHMLVRLVIELDVRAVRERH